MGVMSWKGGRGFQERGEYELTSFCTKHIFGSSERLENMSFHLIKSIQLQRCKCCLEKALNKVISF